MFSMAPIWILNCKPHSRPLNLLCRTDKHERIHRNRAGGLPGNRLPAACAGIRRNIIVEKTSTTDTRRVGKKTSLETKQSMTGWGFLTPAALLIAIMSFYPMLRALLLSFQAGKGTNMKWCGISNYARIAQDSIFQQALINTFLYLIVQVPIMLILALLLASILNNKDLRFKGFFRTCIF